MSAIVALTEALGRSAHRKILTLRAVLWICLHPLQSARLRRKGAWILGGFVGRYYRDNSAALHEYIMHQYANAPVYWVLDKDSPDRERVEMKGSVLWRDERSTYTLALLARVLIVSHGVDDIPTFRLRFHPALRVQLSHGLIGIKPLASANRRHRRWLKRFDLMPVSSPLEAENVISAGVSAKSVVVTGLARLDRLKRLAKSCDPASKRIFIFPTWRPETAMRRRADGYLADLLQSQELETLLESYDATLYIMDHSLSSGALEQQFADAVSRRIVFANDGDVQKWLVACGLLITDYSSICWDFLYLGKPIVFFQFDREEQLSRRPPAIYDPLTRYGLEWPGRVTRTVNETIRAIQLHLENSFYDDELRGRIAWWEASAFQWRDCGNSARVYEATRARAAMVSRGRWIGASTPTETR